MHQQPLQTLQEMLKGSSIEKLRQYTKLVTPQVWITQVQAKNQMTQAKPYPNPGHDYNPISTSKPFIGKGKRMMDHYPQQPRGRKHPNIWMILCELGKNKEA